MIKIKDPKMFWLILYVAINIIATIIMYSTGELIGDTKGNQVFDNSMLLLAMVSVISSYVVICYFLFKLFKKVRVTKIQVYNEIGTHNKLGLIILVSQISFLFFNYINGVNIAGSNNIRTDSIFAIFWALFPVDALFLIYYAVARDSKYFKINLAAYLISSIARGWAGAFLIVIFMEFCRLYRSKSIRFRYVLFATALLLLFYPVLNSIKFYVRLGMPEGGIAQFLDESYLSSIYHGVLHLIERIQITSVLVEVIRIKDTLGDAFSSGAFSPFWHEGLHGIIYDRLFDIPKKYPLSVAFTEYGSFNWEFEVGNWNTNTSLASWFFIAPSLSVFYVFYIFLVCFISYFIMMKISSKDSAKDLLWLSWLFYVIPPWFGTFIQFIYALIVFLFLKILISNIYKKRAV